MINIGSMDGIKVPTVARTGTFPYSASKAAVHHLTKALAVDLGPRNITVNAVAPGTVMTAMSDDFYLAMGNGDMEAGKQEVAKSYPLGRLGQPSDIAGAVVYLASDVADFITGQILFVDGGYSVPSTALNLIAVSACLFRMN